jgi:protein xylosyltransferase
MSKKDSKLKLYSRYLYASLFVFSAVVVQIVLIYYRNYTAENQQHDNPNLTLEQDVLSAVKRAKTSQCKGEIINFAQAKNVSSNQGGSHDKYLERTCPFDSRSKERITKLGCSDQSSPSHNRSLYVSPNGNLINDKRSCNEHCFSFGHAFSAYNLELRECFCVDEELINSITFSSCDGFTGKQLEWFKVNNGVHHSHRGQYRIANAYNEDIRIAFLLSLNGRSRLQIMRLLKNIYSKRHIYYLHVDSRKQYIYEKLKLLQNKHDNIFMSSQRFETIWGSPALLSMMINSLNDLKSLHWHYLINLSESDFPLKNLTDLEKYLASNDLQSLYLKSHSMKGYNFIRKQGLDYDFYQCDGHVWRLGRRQLPLGIIYTGGSDWIGLPKKFCDYIIENKDNKSSLVGSLLSVFNFTLLPAESFFHTLALNSEFCDNLMDNNLRITNWHRKQGCHCNHKDVVDWCGCSPLIYRWSDRQRLKRTALNPTLFFSRKFDSTVSASIIGFVESYLIRKVDTESQIDTRYWLTIYESSEGDLLGAYQEFGQFAIAQETQDNITNYSQITSIDMYFREDSFVGLIYQYCKSSSCFELLVSPLKTNLDVLEENCFGPGLELKSLEVSQNFDPGERLFRNPMPLDTMSDIVVHHEWLVMQDSINNTMNHKDVKFKWISPRNEVELIQNARLKMSANPNRLSLVHRFNRRKPFHSGMWKLKLNNGQTDCLVYKFLVFNSTSFSGGILDRDQFKRFYNVSFGCARQGDSMNAPLSTCALDWSLNYRDLQLMSYSL